MINEQELPDGFIRINIERGGEYITTDVPEGSTVQALIDGDHLRGVQVSSTRVNGAPAENSTPLENGDSVSQIPKSGKQGL